MLELPHDVVEKPKRKLGRPRKYEGGYANLAKFEVRLTHDVFEKAKTAADFMGMSVPDFVAHILKTRAAK